MRVLEALMRRVLQRASTPAVEDFVTRVIEQRLQRLEPDEALRFLFRLDAALYPLHGDRAVAYGGGVHPKHRHTGYHDFFVDRLRAGERVLDIGCGIGALAFDMAARGGAQVTGIDLLPERIAEAQARHAHPSVEYRVGDALTALPERSFDVAVLSNVLEHLPGRADFLARLTRTSGVARLLIRVPLFERDWRVPLKRELGVEWRLDPTHETEYTLPAFMEEMAAAGLRVRHIEVRWGEIWAELVPAARMDEDA